MSFAPIKPIVEKVVDKSVEFVPIVGPTIRYAKTAKKVTKFTNPVRATTYTVGLRLLRLGFQAIQFLLLEECQ